MLLYNMCAVSLQFCYGSSGLVVRTPEHHLALYNYILLQDWEWWARLLWGCQASQTCLLEKNVFVYYKQHSTVWLHSEGGRDSRLTANTGPFNMVSTVRGCTMLCLIHHTKLYKGDIHPWSRSYPLLLQWHIHQWSPAPLLLNVHHCLVPLPYQPLHYLHLVR